MKLWENVTERKAKTRTKYIERSIRIMPRKSTIDYIHTQTIDGKTIKEIYLHVVFIDPKKAYQRVLKGSNVVGVRKETTSS